MSKSLDHLGQLQREVMEVLWDLRQATVHQVQKALAKKRHRNSAYTTILTTLQKLEKSGWVQHHPEGRSYVYSPTRTREHAGGNSVRNFVQSVFGGNALMMFQHLMQESDLSKEECNQIRKWIDDKRREAKS